MKHTLEKTKLAFEDKLVRISVAGAVLPVVVSFILLFNENTSLYLKILVVLLITTSVIFAAFSIRQQVIAQLQTSTNLIEAMAKGDYSLRANNKYIEGALSDFNLLLNKLGERLSEQRLISREQQILLSKITDQIDVAVIACDKNQNISLMNPAAEKLFQKRFDDISGWPIKTLGLQDFTQNYLDKPSLPRSQKLVTEFTHGKGKKRVYVHTDSFFEKGEQQSLVFITDIQHLIRDEERQAWQKLLRVLSHEINNSLTPIASISETLSSMISLPRVRENLDSEIHTNIKEGMQVITERAHSLNHFIQDYQKLAKLPAPNKTIINLKAYIQKICQLFLEAEFSLPSNSIHVYADNEQIEQVLVNVIKNAHEANLSAQLKASEVKSSLRITWYEGKDETVINIFDNGKGVSNIDNLFVPFYTTKKKGSGIGLSLSRQIMLNHNGNLDLRNYRDESGKVKGACATLTLPSIQK